MNKYSIALLAAVLPLPTLAFDGAVCTPDLTVYFGNGMKSSEKTH